MAKSKCKLCGKQLKGGEWVLRNTDDGKVIKICIDRNGCQTRMRQNSGLK